MGHIKEPKGIDLIVNPIPLTTADREAISAIIADFKHTGEVPNKKMSSPKTKPLKRKILKGKSAAQKSKKNTMA